jgi:hypothetical protein
MTGAASPAGRRRLTAVEAVNLALRALLEAAIVAGLSYWGVHIGGTTAAEVALGILAPAVGFGFWGAIDFRRAGRLAEPARLLQELLVSGLAAAAWYAAGRPLAGISLAALSLVYHASVYASGQRLLARQPAPTVESAGTEAARP